MSSDNRQDREIQEEVHKEEEKEDEDEDDEENEDDDDHAFGRSSFFFPGLPSRTNSFSNLMSSSSSSSFDIEAGWDMMVSEASNVRYTPLLSIFENIFNTQLDRLILDEVSSESMQTYHQELLRKNDDTTISERYPIVPFPSATPRNDKCFICMESFTDIDQVLVLDCQHLFHLICIENAVQYNAQCPLCKVRIDCVPKRSG